MIPAISDWLEATSVFGRSRGDELKALDAAIRNFGMKRDAYSRDAVGDAWASWKKAQTLAEKSVFDDKRNRSGMFEILEAEFNPDGLASTRVGAMCRIKLQFPTTRPIGFPNVADATMVDRIDKAFIEAQAVLQVTLGRLKRSDAATKQLVENWFGKTNSVATVTGRYEQVQEYVEKTLKPGVSALEIRWSEEAKNVASTGYHATYMSFGEGFFNDDKAIPSTQLTSAPAVPPGFLDSVRELIAEWDKLVVDKALLRQIIAVAGKDGATLNDAMAVWIKQPGNGSYYNNVRAMAAAYAPFGFKPDDVRAAALAKAQQALIALETREAKMLADADARRPPVTTSGVIIHELTHLVLNTQDVDSPLFKTKTPSYGPGTCLHLASVSPADALNNADNYRLFSESCGF